MERASNAIRRCAVYTRKSSEEGLEQDFNSLHAQREASEAFIKSLQGEGWKLVKTAYDDGGLSGGNMERPALQRLLEDIRHGLIDVVVFDAQGVSFVAVTQQFNTTTSMGRPSRSERPVAVSVLRITSSRQRFHSGGATWMASAGTGAGASSRNSRTKHSGRQGGSS